MVGGLDAGFLAQLARRGCRQRFAGLLAARHRLPVARRVGTLDQQDAQVRRMDEDERRDGNLVRQRTYATKTQNGLCRSRQ